jgi:hypothetical protein
MHARIIAQAGFDKSAVQRYLSAHAGKLLSERALAGKDEAGRRNATASARELATPSRVAVPARPGFEAVDGDEFVLTVADPANILVVVSGGEHVEVSSVLQPFTGGWKVPGFATVQGREGEQQS